MTDNQFHTRLVNALAVALQDDSAARVNRFREEMRSIIPEQEPVGEAIMSDQELGEAFEEVMHDPH